MGGQRRPDELEDYARQAAEAFLAASRAETPDLREKHLQLAYSLQAKIDAVRSGRTPRKPR